MATQKIQATKDYRLFKIGDNRPIDLRKHAKLRESMQKYGFLKCFPIVVTRENGHLNVKDGQHRFTFARDLGLTVHYVLEDADFDVAEINNTAKTWVTKDYALKFAAHGNKDYQEGLDFAEKYKLPVGAAFALLAGLTSFGHISDEFTGGKFKVTDRPWAEAVATMFSKLVGLNPAMNNARFLLACMAACRVEGFDPKRVVSTAERCRDKLGAFSTRDAYMEMIDAVYNYQSKKPIPLKHLATIAMRDRNPATPKKGKDKNAA